MTLLTVNPSASNHDAWQSNTGANTLTGEVRASGGTTWARLLEEAAAAAETAPPGGSEG